MKRVLVSAVALIDADGRILLAKRPEGKSLAGLWEFPGGKVEEGERPEQLGKRQLTGAADALARIGLNDTSLYDGSWAEWGLPDGPDVATGAA